MPCEEIRLFALCQHMQWNHLPNAGGLYDQDPDLLDRFGVIFSRIDDKERQESDKQRAEAEKARSKSKTPRSRLRGGR